MLEVHAENSQTIIDVVCLRLENMYRRLNMYLVNMFAVKVKISAAIDHKPM